MKRLFSIVIIFLIIFCLSSCTNSFKQNNNIEDNKMDTLSSNQNSNLEEKDKIATFDADKQSVIKLFEETGRYVETKVYEFEDDERNICGVIRLNPDDYENLFAEECIYTQVRTYKDKVFDVYLTYDLSGNEKYYEKLPELLKKVLATLKSNVS